MALPPIERAHRELPVSSCRELGHGYAVVSFRAAPPLPGAAGQFAMVHAPAWGSAPLLPRPMSLLSAGSEPSLLVKVVGDGTARLARAQVGERFTLLAPLGRGWNPPAAGVRPILVAGGVGVAPLVLFAAERARAGGTQPLALYGGRSARDLPLADELAAVAELRVATEDGSRGTAGRVTALVAAALAEVGTHVEGVKLYCCGPDAMMAAVAAQAAAHGVACEVSLEAPMACGYGVCLGCAVPRSEPRGFLYACVDGPCIDARAIAWQRSGA